MGGEIFCLMMLVLASPSLAESSLDSGDNALAHPPDTVEAQGERAEIEELLRIDESRKLLLAGKSQEAAQQLAHGFQSTRGKDANTLILRAWSLFETGQFQELLAILPAKDHDNEFAFLRGSALLRSGSTQEGSVLLRQLWWQEPTQVWGVWALWQLAQQNAVGRYLRGERKFILKTVPPPLYRLRVTGRTISIRSLNRLARNPFRKGQLRAEVRHALGARYLESEKLPEAIANFRRAIKAKPGLHLRRAIHLDLGEAHRRRGAYKTALIHFEKVASGYVDTLSDEARSRAGQMAIEYRRYDDAQRHFETQLISNPLGTNRNQALWGLGWVATRRGQFVQARQFFQTLLENDPYGERAAASIYWGARAAQELGETQTAMSELIALVQRFPVDYYAHRAGFLINHQTALQVVTPAASLPVPVRNPELTHVEGLSRAGLTEQALKKLRSTLHAAYSDFGPEELELGQVLASQLKAPRLAARFRGIRHRRYPQLSKTTVRTLAANFPDRYVSLVKRTARRFKLEENLLVGLSRQESAFNPRAVSPVGALGLMQLMPTTAADLLGVSVDSEEFDSHRILKPATNVTLGCRYFKRMLKVFKGTQEYALAAYNAGPGAVARWRKRGELPVEVFVEEIPYAETREYVKRVLSWKRKYEFLQRARSQVQELARRERTAKKPVALR